MLTRDAFWDLIGTLGGSIDQQRAQTLTDWLAGREGQPSSNKNPWWYVESSRLGLVSLAVFWSLSLIFLLTSSSAHPISVLDVLFVVWTAAWTFVVVLSAARKRRLQQ